MLTLKNFLRMGVIWTGPDAERLKTRRCRVLLEHVAEKVKADRPCAPVRLATRNLSDDLYKERAARMALAELVSLGVIQRERQRSRKEKREDVALTRMHQDIVVAAARWTAARQALRDAGKRRKDELPAPIEIAVPLTWPGEQQSTKNDPKPPENEPKNEPQKDPAPMEMKNPLKSDPTSGNPHEQGLSEEPACKECSHGYAKFAETGIPHPHSPAQAGVGGGVQAPAAGPGHGCAPDPALAPLPSTPGPAQAGTWGVVVPPITIDSTGTIKKQNGRKTVHEQLEFRRWFRQQSIAWKGSQAQAVFFARRREGL